VRIEFCEADVLDVFDEWRRAVGVTVLTVAGDDTAGREEPGQAAHRHGSLPVHLERVVARLTALRAGDDRSLDALLDGIVREIDAARAPAQSLRGDARDRLVERLREIDRLLLDAARRACDAATTAAIEAEAERELAPFRGRMPHDAYARSHAAAVDRLVRERWRLPVVVFE
jgi:hypothetical protein